jgi:cytochrome P450
MVLYPEIQRKVHEELDKQIGCGRAPDMNEIKELEYFNAAWNESMRWNATVPLGKLYIAYYYVIYTYHFAFVGLPHVSSQDDTYQGYYIPKGTIVNCNIGFGTLNCMSISCALTKQSRYILRDPKLWGADADKYNPNRFLAEFNPRVKELPDMSSVPFGFGRR